MKKVLSLLILVLLSISISLPVSAEIITDTTGPTVTNAFCDKQGQTLKPGDTVKFSFSASDPSGLEPGISVNFYEATSYSGRWFDWTYNSSTNKYETSFTIPQSAKDGEYYISTIYVYDIYDNQTAYSTHLGFKVKGNISDTTGPTVTNASCDKQGQTLKPGDTVKFSFSASDPSGLEPGISVNFYEATSYSGRWFDWTYNSSTNKYETSFTIPQSAKKGEYYISTIYVYDIHDNQTAYSTHLGFYIGMENPNNTTTKPSGTETTKPSGTETTKPSGTETTKPSGTETTKPSGSETTKPSGTETTKPSGTETTKPSGSETTKPSDSTTTDTTKKEPSNILWVIIASIVSVVAIAGVGTVVVIRKKQNKA